VVLGTTTGTSSSLTSSCNAGNTAPEKVYTWTPAISGTAVIETCSTTQTTYDTVLYLRRGACLGAEVACNDDTTGCGTTTDVTNPHRGSRLTVAVTAGQTYYLIVDGWLGNKGAFRLSVVAPTTSTTTTSTTTTTTLPPPAAPTSVSVQP